MMTDAYRLSFGAIAATLVARLVIYGLGQRRKDEASRLATIPHSVDLNR